MKLGQRVLLSGLLLTAAVGCKSNFDRLQENPNANKDAWYNSQAQLCSDSGPRPACTYRYNGEKIQLSNDPYYSKISGITFDREGYELYEEYIEEVCVSTGGSGSCTTWEKRVATARYTEYRYFLTLPDGQRVKASFSPNDNSYVASLDGWKIYVNWREGYVDILTLESPNKVQYDAFTGKALNAANAPVGTSRGLDVVGELAAVRADQVGGMAEMLQAKFALDTDVSEQAAHAYVDWAEVSSRRSRTKEDMAAFSKNVYGIELQKIEDVIALTKEGKVLESAEKYNSLLNAAARNWRTSPETMSEVLKFFYGNLID